MAKGAKDSKAKWGQGFTLKEMGSGLYIRNGVRKWGQGFTFDKMNFFGIM